MFSPHRFILFVVLLVIVAGIASAETPGLVVPQVPIMSCQPYNQQTARLRSEGVTELIPDLTLVCMSTYQIPNTPEPRKSGTYYDWFVYFPANAPLTSSTAKIDGWMEPQIGIQVVPVVGGVAQTPESDIQWQSASKMTAGNGSSGGSVEFDTVNMNPYNDQYRPEAPGDLFNNVFVTIVGLRVDAIALASSGPLSTPNALTLTLFAQPSHTTSAVNQQNPGNIFLPTVNGVQQYTLSISVGYSAPSLTVSEKGAFKWRQCVSWSNPYRGIREAVAAKITPAPAPVGGGGGSTGYNNLQFFAVDFTELYSYAFAPKTDGWEIPAYGGIRLAFVFSSDGENAWPSFVHYAVPVAVDVWDSSSGTIVEANLVTDTNPDGSGGTIHYYGSGSWTSNSYLFGSNAAPGTYFSSGDDGILEITGATMVVYEIAVVPPAQPAVTTTLEVPVFGGIFDTPTIYPPGDDPDAQVTIVQAGYAPWTPASVPQESPIPRFHLPPPFSGSNLLEIVPCTTNLLYPYIVAGMGWDTGVTVANSGMDPYPWGYSGVCWYCLGPDSRSTAPAVPGNTGDYNYQPGVCWFYFYGSIDRGAPLVTPDTNPPNPIALGAAGFGSGSVSGDDPGDYIQPGTTAEDLVMAVLALNNPAVDFSKHSWNGYAIAQCDFLYAHGYAFTVFHDKSFTLGGNLSLGYLALVFDQRGLSHPSQVPERMTF